MSGVDTPSGDRFRMTASTLGFVAIVLWIWAFVKASNDGDVGTGLVVLVGLAVCAVVASAACGVIVVVLDAQVEARRHFEHLVRVARE